MMIHVVANGIVMPYLLDRNLETHLPVLPPEVDEVRFRWRAGKRKYRYNFYRLESHDQVSDLKGHKPSLSLAPASEPHHRHRNERANPSEDRGFLSPTSLHGKPYRHCQLLNWTRDPLKVRKEEGTISSRCRKRKLAGTPLKLRLRWGSRENNRC